MSLHCKIMNLQAKTPHDLDKADGLVHAYRMGHRDARHAAAELALKADAVIEAAQAVLSFRHDTATTGYLRDNDESRDALHALAAAAKAVVAA